MLTCFFLVLNKIAFSEIFLGLRAYWLDSFSALFLSFFLISKKSKKSKKFFFLSSLGKKRASKIGTFFRFSNLLKFFKHQVVLDNFFLKLLFVFESSAAYLNMERRVSSRISQSGLGFFGRFSWQGLQGLAPRLNPYATVFSTAFLIGLRSIWRGLRFWVLSLVIGLSIFYGLMAFRFVPLLKISFQWLCIVMFLYWLMSGFVFFVKKYQTSKFTTVIQRFWRRSYILFWLIETTVFATFLYVTFNASQEPFYMHDQIKVFKTHFFSWRLLLLKVAAVAMLIIFTYCLLLFLKWNIYTKQSILFFFVTLFLTYIVWLEFYQFFHILSYYGGIFWSFDSEERAWVLEADFKRTRIVNNYVALCLMAKFWHLIFIYVFWIFFILRANELQRYRYPLLSANLQNFIILYIMCWLFMYPWIKHYVRRYMDYTYYWFFTNARELGIRVFFTDLKLFFFSFHRLFLADFKYFYKFYALNFYYWIDASPIIQFDGFKKHYIKNSFLHAYYTNFF